MIRVCAAWILTIGLCLAGCAEKREEAKALEKEVIGDRAAVVMDSLAAPAKPEPQKDTSLMTPPPAEVPQAAKPVAPALKPALSDVDGFVIQLGSYADQDLATAKAEEYQRRGYHAFVSRAEVGGRTVYRLRIGVYDTYQEAQEVGRLLADRYSAQFWIDRNR